MQGWPLPGASVPGNAPIARPHRPRATPTPWALPSPGGPTGRRSVATPVGCGRPRAGVAGRLAPATNAPTGPPPSNTKASSTTGAPDRSFPARPTMRAPDTGPGCATTRGRPLPGVPLRTMMACADGTRDRHLCRGIIPPGAGPAELCACACHEHPRRPGPVPPVRRPARPPPPLPHDPRAEANHSRRGPALPFRLKPARPGDPSPREEPAPTRPAACSAHPRRRVPSGSSATQTCR